MKYSLYEFLYEDAPPPQRVGRHGDSTVPTTNNPPTNPPTKIRAPRAKIKPSPYDKPSKSGRMEFEPSQLITKMREKIKNELPAISNLANKKDPSKEEVVAAKKAIEDVDPIISAIADMKGYKTKPEPQQPVVSSAASSTALPQPSARSITTPQEQKPTKSPSPQQATQAALAFAKTQPQPQYRPNQTQPVPQVDIERTMRNAPTTPLPQATPTKQSLFQRFRNRIGLEEAIKQAFKDAINNR